jgi:beta-N-acetylhexosaminidase
MSRIRSRRAAVVATAALALGAAGGAVAAPSSASPASATPSVASLVRSMTLDEKIGQLFVTYAYGDTADTTDPTAVAENQQLYGVDDGAQLVAKYHLGGVIYFTWANTLTDPTTIATLSNGLQASATSSGARVPLLVSTDQEGGWVVRINAPFAVNPSNMALGATGSPVTAYAMSRATGQQLGAVGINVDDAPVVDTNTNPANTADGTRAFGDTALQTSIFGAASVLGLQSTGVGATAKHFPGLGSTSVNTDFGESTSDETRAQFEKNDLPAFRAAIAAGTDEIMAAHIVAPSLDPSGAPASLSNPMVTGILRHELHYNGVVITDSLAAAALGAYTDAERAVKAIQAGDDQLLMPTDLGAAIQAVKDAVASGQITTARIDQSVTRVLTLKQKLGLFKRNQVDVSAVASHVGTAAQNAAMNTAAHNAVTLFRNSDKVLPLVANSHKKVLVTGYGVSTSTTLTADLTAKGVDTTRIYTGAAPSESLITSTVAAAKDEDYAVVISNDAWGAPALRELTAKLQASGTPTIVLATGAPYELGYLPDSSTFLATYSYQPAALQAATDVLFGAQPRGHSPITIRTPDGSSVVAARGTGLHY